jgi:hypothetical protein
MMYPILFRLLCQQKAFILVLFWSFLSLIISFVGEQRGEALAAQGWARMGCGRGPVRREPSGGHVGVGEGAGGDGGRVRVSLRVA